MLEAATRTMCLSMTSPRGEALNWGNDRQEVYDSHRNTPLSYRAGYRDPIGRTIEFEIRKVF
jgi:hypothetical protein